MFQEVISRDRQSLLELLGRQDILKNFYLAGGTAAALHLGHRLSEDFDFFSQHLRQHFKNKTPAAVAGCAGVLLLLLMVNGTTVRLRMSACA